MSMPSTMPPVLHFFQYSVSRMQGKLAEAATAKASATRCATFWPFAAMPMVMAFQIPLTWIQTATVFLTV